MEELDGNDVGRGVCRWLYEFLVRVVGWSAVDTGGSKWTTYVDTGAAGESVVDYPLRFDIGSGASHDFTSADIGAYLTITGFTPAIYDGVYRIKKIISDKVVEIDEQYSVHSAGIPCDQTGITWRLWRNHDDYLPDPTHWVVFGGTGTVGGGYTFHLHMTVRATGSSTLAMPEFILSPFASWNAGSHSWDDSKYTSTVQIGGCGGQPGTRLFAAADTDRLVLMMKQERQIEYGGTVAGNFGWRFFYAGEIDQMADAADDPKPCVLWEGGNVGNTVPGQDTSNILGYNAGGDLYNGGIWLANDGTTSVAGYLMIAATPTDSNQNWFSDQQRRFGQDGGNHYRGSLMCECRTSGYMEVRGLLRRVWAGGEEATRCDPVGANNEFLHVIGGITIPWNGSRCFQER